MKKLRATPHVQGQKIRVGVWPGSDNARIYQKMALISNANGRADVKTSAYFRIFAEDENDKVAEKLASMVSKIHATSISNGCKLEKLIASPDYNSHNPRDKVSARELNEGHFCHIKVLQTDCPAIVGQDKIEVDYVVVGPDVISLFELKDGDTFDTKKSKGEINSLKTVQAYLKSLYPDKDVRYHFVLWNTADIKPGSIKVNDIEVGVMMTGAEFCARMNLDYAAINNSRRSVAKDNKKWFMEQLKVFDN